jgi:hypothetical protein
MLPNNYLVSEQHYVCDVCSEAVTNPLCPRCLATEIEAWLTLYPNLKEEMLPKLNIYLRKLGDRIDTSTACIKCRNENASVCPYCFTEFVLDELKKIQVSKIILKEFLEFFNFRSQIPSPHAKKWGYKQTI